MVLTVALRLFAGFESTSWASIFFAIVTAPPAFYTFPYTTLFRSAALLSVPPVQLAVLVVVLNPQLKPPPLALTAEMMAPRGWSSHWSWAAVLGPRLVTVSV